MPRQLRCADLMPACHCTFVATGKDADDIMAKAAEHARKEHGIAAIPAELEAKVRAAIGDTAGS